MMCIDEQTAKRLDTGGVAPDCSWSESENCGGAWRPRQMQEAQRAALLLFLGGDAERFHLAVEIAALEPEHFGGSGDVALALIQHF